MYKRKEGWKRPDSSDSSQRSVRPRVGEEPAAAAPKRRTYSQASSERYREVRELNRQFPPKPDVEQAQKVAHEYRQQWRRRREPGVFEAHIRETVPRHRETRDELLAKAQNEYLDRKEPPKTFIGPRLHKPLQQRTSTDASSARYVERTRKRLRDIDEQPERIHDQRRIQQGIDAAEHRERQRERREARPNPPPLSRKNEGAAKRLAENPRYRSDTVASSENNRKLQRFGRKLQHDQDTAEKRGMVAQAMALEQKQHEGRNKYRREGVVPKLSADATNPVHRYHDKIVPMVQRYVDAFAPRLGHGFGGRPRNEYKVVGADAGPLQPGNFVGQDAAAAAPAPVEPPRQIRRHYVPAAARGDDPTEYTASEGQNTPPGRVRLPHHHKPSKTAFVRKEYEPIAAAASASSHSQPQMPDDDDRASVASVSSASRSTPKKRRTERPYKKIKWDEVFKFGKRLGHRYTPDPSSKSSSDSHVSLA